MFCSNLLDHPINGSSVHKIVYFIKEYNVKSITNACFFDPQVDGGFVYMFCSNLLDYPINGSFVYEIVYFIKEYNVKSKTNARFFVIFLIHKWMAGLFICFVVIY